MHAAKSIARVTLASPLSIELSYGPEGSSEPFPFFCELMLACNAGAGTDRDRQRLHNLGYPLDLEFEMQAMRFQEDYQVDNDPEPLGLENGALPSKSRQLLDRIFEDRQCDATPPT